MELIKTARGGTTYEGIIMKSEESKQLAINAFIAGSYFNIHLNPTQVGIEAVQFANRVLKPDGTVRTLLETLEGMNIEHD